MCILDYLKNLFLKDPAMFWTMAATVVLAIIAWIQLRKISKTANADFIRQFKDVFFTPETRQLIMLIDQKLMRFMDEPLPYFVVIEGSLPDFIRAENARKFYTSYDLDDLLLGHFEDLGLFAKRGIITIEMAYEFFSWYIETTWENNEIKKYIESQRKTEGEDIYENFEYIYKKCNSYRNGKYPGSTPIEVTQKKNDKE